MSRLWWLLALFAANLTSAAASGTLPGRHWWGVIVGVGEYEHLDPSLTLDGPAHDIPLVLNWLERQGVPRQHLTVLADHVPRVDGLPRQGAILQALAALPAKVAAGDMVFLYFAGHGTQQPEGGAAWSKSDGLEEVFLPRDVGRWDGQSGQIDGAITGAEIGRRLDALRARGAFVWLVFDSCHAATMARAMAVPHLRTRAVAPDQLGVPAMATGHAGVAGHGFVDDPADADTPTEHMVHLHLGANAGHYVAFYAAQTTDIAPEMPLPPGENGNQVHGLFTYALLHALGATGVASYRELAHRILAFYAATYPATTPEFEGALDEVIGTPGAPLLPPDAWPTRRLAQGFRVNAGRLNGLTPQSLLALYPAVSTTATPLGLLVVDKVDLTDAWANPIADPRELKEWKVPRDRTAEVASGVVRVLRTGVDTTVRVAGPAACFRAMAPPLGCGTFGGDADAAATGANAAIVDRAHALAMNEPRLPAGMEYTPNINAADLYLWVKHHRLYVIPSVSTSQSISADRAASLDLDSPSAGEDLRRILFRACRAVGLLRLARDFPETPGDLIADVRTRESMGRWRPIGTDTRMPVPFGAELSVLLQNTGHADLDVTILAIDDHFGITTVYPVDQESNLLREGSARIDISGWARTPGDNQLVFILEKARAGRPHDLGYLAQPGVARKAHESGLAALLEQIGFEGRVTRSNFSEEDRAAASMRIIRYQVAGGS
jgi:hypothetical protein